MQSELHKASVWITALTLPTGGTEDGVSRLLIALLLAPHPLFADPLQSDDAARAIARPSIGSRRA
ncbi:hypothetical protein IVB18_31245 [Bradyrhizobium sp. 186]|uniref:hypothetical protein n=1 Tax=Bradyrhizobium sp. 186 TaxID=2782654 RepID=UPI002000C171|nr:hypothetical protein [Bradyrhizobium sp. 186]UPK32718.1 hypothetical protein IVB18_31245 [Bradyrhizobium sp. 186]